MLDREKWDWETSEKVLADIDAIKKRFPSVRSIGLRPIYRTNKMLYADSYRQQMLNEQLPGAYFNGMFLAIFKPIR